MLSRHVMAERVRRSSCDLHDVGSNPDMSGLNITMLADYCLRTDARPWHGEPAESLLMATIVLESFMPARCWMAPLMPSPASVAAERK